MAAGSYQFSVPESELVSAVVARVRAVDLDEGPNADLDYRILDGDGLGTFSITTDSHTQEGLITLHKVGVTAGELVRDQFTCSRREITGETTVCFEPSGSSRC